MPHGTGGETAKRWSLATIKHTGQAVGAVILMITVLYAFLEPAINQYVQNAVADPINTLAKKQKKAQDEQKIWRQKQEEKTNKVINRQSVIIEKQRVGEILDAEQRADVKNILRLLRRRETE